MYMLLMIYAMCNLHVVSWGTREVKQTPTEKQMQEEKQAEIENKKNKGLINKVGGFMSLAKRDEEKDGWTMSCGTCCSYICCPHKVNNEERVVELKLILSEMKHIESNMKKDMETQMDAIHQYIDDKKSNNQFIPPGKADENQSSSGYSDTQGYHGFLAESVESTNKEVNPTRGKP